MKPPTTDHDYQPHIDGLRAVAVLAVLVFHAFPKVLAGGFVGVDIFFVISGFLISSILYTGFNARQSSAPAVVANFYCRRINRIFPALIVILIASGVMGYYLLMPRELQNFSRQAIAGAAFYLNLLVAGQTDYFVPDPASNPLLHLWSLGVEEQFYLVWPLFLWTTVRCGIQPLAAVLFVTAASFSWNALRLPGLTPGAFYLPQMRLWELSLGAGVAAILPALLTKQTISPARAQTLSVGGLGLIAAGFMVINGEMDLPNSWLLLPTCGTALVIIAGKAAWVNRVVLANPLLVWIGLISYPLYLWHWPLLTFARLASEKPDAPLIRVGALVGAVLLASLTYRFIEVPCRRFRRSWRMAVLLVSGLIVLVALSLFTRASQGFPGRVPSLLNEISAYQHDPAAAIRQGTYFLQGDQDESNFKRDPAEIDPRKPTLYLWGDSHAASLYPGLSTIYGGRYNIVQRTTAKTPPFVPEYFNPGNAQQINRYILDSIKRDQPSYVILHANWMNYEWAHVEATVTALRTAGIKHIILIGPVPQWVGSLPQQLYNYARRHPDAPVPTRMREGLDPRIKELDRLIASLAAKLDIVYVSAQNILCNEEGCLVRTADTADSLVTHDSSHLTVEGSKYVVTRLHGLE